MNDERHSAGTVIIAFLAGGLVGAGIALLTAPRSGKETREKIGEIADEAKDKIRSVAEDARAKMVETFGKGKDILDEKKSAITHAIEAGKKAMEDDKAARMGR